ncbi:MAG: hypothetical protein R3324_13545 [Halobacteriales archaeon]|nr:hypothetical protein [Halobacteriales archaeon]
MFETQTRVTLLLAVAIALVAGYAGPWAGRTGHLGRQGLPHGATQNELCRRDGNCTCWSAGELTGR